MNRIVIYAAGLALLLTGVGHTQSLEDRLKTLEEKLKVRVEEEKGSSPAIDLFFKDGLQAKSRDGNFELHIGGRVIIHARAFSRNNERVSSDSFSIRETKIDLMGKLWKDWEFRVEAQSTGPNFFIDDAYIGFVRFKWLKIRAGQFKAPFSMDQVTSTLFIDFPERAAMDRLAPSYELGIQVSGEPVEKIWSYALMASNGTGRAGIDENSDKDLTFRTWVRPGATSESAFFKGLHLGLNASYGRIDKKSGVMPYTFSNPFTQTVFASPGATAPAVKFDESRSRLSGEFAWLIGPAAIKAEYTRTNDQYSRLASGDNHHTHITAWYATAMWMITGEQKTWDRPRPARPLFGPEGGFGSLEVLARFSRWEFNRNILDSGILNRDTSARTADEYAVAVNWYPNANVRVTLSYAWVNYKSDAHTEPVVVNGKRFDKEDVVLLRIQVDF